MFAAIKNVMVEFTSEILPKLLHEYLNFTNSKKGKKIVLVSEHV